MTYDPYDPAYDPGSGWHWSETDDAGYEALDEVDPYDEDRLQDRADEHTYGGSVNR